MLEWSDAGSWYSAESNVEHGGGSIQTSALLPIVQNDNPHIGAPVDVALSHISVDDLSRPQQSDHAEDLADDHDKMSISDIDPSETHANSSLVTADSFGTLMNNNDDRKYEGLSAHPSSSRIVPRNELSPVGDHATSSSNRLPPSGRVLTRAQCSIIGHSDKHTDWFDKYGVPWSAQWQIAVLVSNKWKEWEQITEQDVKALSGTNSIVGPKILGVLFPDDRRRASDNQTPSCLGNLYVELDREEAALNKGTLETLGLSSQSEDTTHLSIGTWWGGRIEQRAVLVHRLRKHVGVFSYDTRLFEENLVDLLANLAPEDSSSLDSQNT
ncbi:hypothetical protein FRC00_002045 [Tulasnella sp. 408]|nr:hypothetical protein FRC00_002045 [Tulasnella sp. 408]